MITNIAKKRVCRIYRPSPSPTQSGYAPSFWKIDFETSNKGKWSNDLMGWTSSRDPLQAMAIKFDTKESACRFADKRGWIYKIEEYKETKVPEKNYASNFKWFSSDVLPIINTK